MPQAHGCYGNHVRGTGAVKGEALQNGTSQWQREKHERRTDFRDPFIPSGTPVTTVRIGILLETRTIRINSKQLFGDDCQDSKSARPFFLRQVLSLSASSSTGQPTWRENP